jgi:tetratricopeptide (TPR) repeat protein
MSPIRALRENGRRLICVGVAMAAALATMTLTTGCAERREPQPCACPGPGKVLDQELMVRLSSARSLHHQADIYLQQGEVRKAIETVRRILALDLDPRWPEAEEARLDARARLAKLLLGQEDEDGALKVVREGIDAARRTSFYLSNLHSVRGEVLEHRSKRLRREGDEEGAKIAAREAITAFERSITLNKKLQQDLMREAQKGK